MRQHLPKNEKTGRANEPFDLHLHSLCSDGTDTPARVIERAAEAGITLAALTDHDNVRGVKEACEAGERLGVRVLPALEMDCEWPHELHILGLDVDIAEAGLFAALETARQRRVARNAGILRLLREAGRPIDDAFAAGADTATRLNIAVALEQAGYADSVKDAFVRFLRKGCVAYYTVERFAPETVISLIRGAGGIPVWAHPMHGRPDPHQLSAQLRDWGLMGIEAFHPSLSEGESNVLLSISRQLGLIATCGSDYHGGNRPAVQPGQTWRPHPALLQTRARIEERPVRRIEKTDGAARG